MPLRLWVSITVYLSVSVCLCLCKTLCALWNVCETKATCGSVPLWVCVCVLGVRGLSQTGEQVNLRLRDTWNKITLP